MKEFSLEGKNILVTGASSGIGRAIAIKLSEAGAKLTITGRDSSRLSETMSSLKGPVNHSFMTADLTNETDITSLIDFTGNLDGVVHSAGILKPFPVKFITGKHFDEIRKINYEAPVILTASLLKAKKINNGSAFVFISSVSSRYGYKGGALYTGTKAALDSFSRTLALEHAAQQIRSNTINAGMVRTRLFDQAADIITSDMMEAHGNSYPLGFGEPEDIANAALFLLSPASKWITGTSLIMDGGLTAGT